MKSKVDQLEYLKLRDDIYLKKGLISKDKYYEDMEQISNYVDILSLHDDIQVLRKETENDQINADDRDSKMQELAKIINEYKKSFSEFLDSFAKKQLLCVSQREDKNKAVSEIRRLIDDAEKQDVEKYKIEEYLNELSEFLKVEQKPLTKIKGFIEKTNPTIEAKSGICIEDDATKQEICDLYGIKRSDDVDIIACYVFENDNSTNEGKKAIGHKMNFYSVDKRTGQINDLYFPEKNEKWEVGFNGKKLEGEENSYDVELMTLKNKDVELSFYLDSKAQLHVGREIDGKIYEVSVTNLERYEERREELEHENYLKSASKKSEEELNLKNKVKVLNFHEKAQALSDFEESLESVLEDGYTDKKNYVSNVNSAVAQLKEVIIIQQEILDLKMGLLENKANNNAEYMVQAEIIISKKEEELNNLIKKFAKSFVQIQKNDNRITAEEEKNLLGKEQFGIEDIETLYSKLEDIAIKCINEVKNESKEIKCVSYIEDFETKKRLCGLYGINNMTNVDILAIQKNGVELQADKAIALYRFDRTNNSLKRLRDKNVKQQVVTSNEEINVTNNDGTNLSTKEIATISYSGLKLTFYSNKNGKMCIARNTDDGIKEIKTFSPEFEEKVDSVIVSKNIKTRIKSANEIDVDNSKELNINKVNESEKLQNKEEPDYSNVTNVEEMRKILKGYKVRQFLNKVKGIEENISDSVRNQLDEMQRIVTLTDKQKAARQEKVDREYLNARRRFA